MSASQMYFNIYHSLFMDISVGFWITQGQYLRNINFYIMSVYKVFVKLNWLWYTSFKSPRLLFSYSNLKIKVSRQKINMISCNSCSLVKNQVSFNFISISHFKFKTLATKLWVAMKMLFCFYFYFSCNKTSFM